MAVPILPTTATPLEKKRKRANSHIIDLTGDEDEHHAIVTPRRTSPGAALDARNCQAELQQANGNSSPAANHNADREDEDEEVDGESDEDGDDVEATESDMEDLVDDCENDPYEIPDGSPFSKEHAASMRARLRQIGPHQFFEETMNSGTIDMRTLGTAFGLEPDLFPGNDKAYLTLFGTIIVRFYMKRMKLQQYNTIDDAAALLKRSHNVMVITGAGISTSLGIPDFRSKGTGFYEKIKEKGYSEPEEVFDIRNFDEDPAIFYSLAGDILPDQKKFSPTHAFIRLLQDKDRLQTNYTQNIDNLEELAGIDEKRIIQCHGSFATATCRKCRHKVKGTEIFDDIRAKRIAVCKRCVHELSQAVPPQKKKSKWTSRSAADDDDDDEDDDIPQPGIMKPDITFFGEQLPSTFFDRFTERDAQQTDLVIVIGTSLKVAPVSEMPNHLPHEVPHIYISREPIQHVAFDIQLLGNCDDVVFELSRRTGWNLKHEMIPAGLSVNVAKAFEDQPHYWTVQRHERTNEVDSTGQTVPPATASSHSH